MIDDKTIQLKVVKSFVLHVIDQIRNCLFAEFLLWQVTHLLL